MSELLNEILPTEYTELKDPRQIPFDVAWSMAIVVDQHKDQARYWRDIADLNDTPDPFKLYGEADDEKEVLERIKVETGRKFVGEYVTAHYVRNVAFGIAGSIDRGGEMAENDTYTDLISRWNIGKMQKHITLEQFNIFKPETHEIYEEDPSERLLTFAPDEIEDEKLAEHHDELLSTLENIAAFTELVEKDKLNMPTTRQDFLSTVARMRRIENNS